jgi:hypothetical protein
MELWGVFTTLPAGMSTVILKNTEREEVEINRQKN